MIAGHVSYVKSASWNSLSFRFIPLFVHRVTPNMPLVPRHSTVTVTVTVTVKITVEITVTVTATVNLFNRARKMTDD